MEKVYTYEIDPTTFQVIIYENKNPLVIQPINPMTGKPFSNVNEAEAFAIEQILSLYNVADINELKILRIKYIEQKFAEIINKIIPVDYAVSDITQLLYSLISLKGLTTKTLDDIILSAYKNANDILSGNTTLNNILATIIDTNEAMLTGILIEKIIKAIWYMQALQVVDKKKSQIESLTNINDIVAIDISEEEIPLPPKL